MFKDRKRRIASAAKKAGLDALLITHPPDVRYLTGFTGSNAAVLVRGARVELFTDGRYTTQAAQEVECASVTIVDQPVALAACEFAVGTGVKRCGFDSAQMTVEAVEHLRASLPAGRRKNFLVPTPGLLAGLREIKDEVEQDQMRASAALGCRLFDPLVGGSRF